MKTLPIHFLVLLLVLTFASCTDRGEALSGIEAGATRGQILSAVGEPDEQDTITKHEEAIWGPEEEFWHQIPLGAKLDRWKYVTDEGTFSLYFREHEDRLAFKVFAPAGAVYEGGG